MAAGSRVDTPADYIRPTNLEIATASVVGLLPAVPLPPPSRAPLQALEHAIRPWLVDPPCYVAFSGGRDSSAILAVATDVARREGLDLPVPATRIYPDAPRTDESEWQRMVIDHLGLTEWTRVTFHDEHELLGMAARDSLRRRGLLWPPALQIHGGWYETLGPGSVLTGEGGDDVLGGRRVTPVAALMRRRRPSRTLLSEAIWSAAPRPARRARLRSRWIQLAQPWLRQGARERNLDAIVDEMAAEPLRYDHATWRISRRRSWAVYAHNHARVAADHGVRAVDPFLDTRFLASLAHFGGRLGPVGRTATMRALFAELLPPEVLARRTKALFDEAYMGASTSAFAREWDGTGVDRELVDVDVLCREWLSDQPSPTSALLLQSAWLGSEGSGRSCGAA